MKLKRFLIGFVLTVFVIAAWAVKMVWDAGTFKTLEPHFSGACKQVEGVAGPEDIAIHPATGIAYISAYDRRAVLKGEETERGIYAYDTNKPNAKPKLLTTGPQKEFRPHGISLFISPDGNDRLFVINHANEHHTVEIYEVQPNALNHLKTVEDPQLISPNDLVAVGPNQFYLTNDHRYRSGLMSTVETYLKFRFANIVYYDGKSFSVVAADFGYANGINVSADGTKLYMAAVLDKTLYSFNRNVDTGALEANTELYLNSGLDNIDIDADGNLWIASHPKLLSFLAHAGDPAKISPSQVFKISVNAEEKLSAEEVYLNEGEELSASSVASVFGNRMLVGAVFDPKFLDCRLNE